MNTVVVDMNHVYPPGDARGTPSTMIYRPSMALQSKPGLGHLRNDTRPLNEDLNCERIYEDLNTKYAINANALNNKLTLAQ